MFRIVRAYKHAFVYNYDRQRLEKGINFVIFIQVYENTIYYFMSSFSKETYQKKI